MAKIYISSTFSDLKECRTKVYDTLRALRHDVIAMEDYVATDQHPLDKCLADVAASDIYVGIFAWRYGFIPAIDNPNQKSITELEFRHALSHTLHCLIFLLDEKAPWPRNNMEFGEGQKLIEILRQELANDYTVSFFIDSTDLAKSVVTAVADLERKMGSHESPTSIEEALKPFSYLDKLTSETNFDHNLVAFYRGQLRPGLKAKYPDHISNGSFLEKLGVMISGRLTLNGLLLFTEQPNRYAPSAITKCSTYPGTLRVGNDGTKKDDFTGPVYEQIEQAYNFVISNIDRRELRTADRAELGTIYQYPVRCIRETISNALCHRDYSIAKQTVQIRVFSDRVEIDSPGAWFGKILEDGRQYSLLEMKFESELRNPTLATSIFNLSTGQKINKTLPRWQIKMREVEEQAA